MASNYKGEGKTIRFTPAAAVTSGAVVVINDIAGVALSDVAANAEGVAAIEGVFEVTKAAPLAVSAGEVLFWDVDPGAATKTETDAVMLGIAHADAAEAATVVEVKLLPVPTLPATS